MEPKLTGSPLTLEIISHRFRTRLPEWQSAAATALLGWVFLVEGETFSLDVYQTLREWASEETWGGILLVLGVSRLVVLGINGALPRGSPHIRSALSSLTMLVWLALFAGYWQAPVPSAMVAFIGTALVVEFVNIFRAAASARVEDFIEGERKHGSID